MSARGIRSDALWLLDSLDTLDEAGSPPDSLFEGPSLPLAATAIRTERTSPGLIDAFAIARADCQECHGDGWSRGWGPGPCRACAEAEDRKRVPY